MLCLTLSGAFCHASSVAEQKQFIKQFAMKKALLVSLLALIELFLNAQEADLFFFKQYDFEQNFSGAHVLEVGTDETPDEHCYMLAVCDLTTDFSEYETIVTYPAKILKLSTNGELLNELVIGEEGRRSVVYKVFQIPDDPSCFLAVGKIHNNELHYDIPLLAKFDLQLNLLWLREIQLPEAYRKWFFRGQTMMDSQGDIIYCTAPFDANSQSLNSNLIHLRLSQEGELLELSEFPHQTYYVDGGQGELFEYQDGSGDYGQSIRPSSNTMPNAIYRFNRDLEIVGQQDLPNDLYLPLGAVIPSLALSLHDTYEAVVFHKKDGTIIVGTTARESFLKPNGLTDHTDLGTLAILKLDSESNLDTLVFVGHDNDSLDLLAFNKGMDNYGEEVLYFCNFQVYPNDIEPTNPNDFVVTKTDADANILWQRYLHDRRNIYRPASIVVSSDGGCLVSGYRQNSTNLTECEVFLLKVFPDGTLSVHDPEITFCPFSFYPNPVKEQLLIQFSPDVQPKQIELYDLQGRLVRSQSKAFESIDMGQLPAGTYTLRVTLEDGKVFSDKVVKE